jgi:hypothetical protein
MKKFTIVFTIITAILLGGRFFCTVHAQSPATSDIPVFYRPVPGTYVNPWPRLTITYPKDWVERRPNLNETFRVSAPGPVPSPQFVYTPFYGDAPPLDKMADATAFFLRNFPTLPVSHSSEFISHLFCSFLEVQ